jgi:hypothetical protein
LLRPTRRIRVDVTPHPVEHRGAACGASGPIELPADGTGRRDARVDIMATTTTSILSRPFALLAIDAVVSPVTKKSPRRMPTPTANDRRMGYWGMGWAVIVLLEPRGGSSRTPCSR